VVSDIVTAGRLGLNHQQLIPVDFPKTVCVSCTKVTSRKALTLLSTFSFLVSFSKSDPSSANDIPDLKGALLSPPRSSSFSPGQIADQVLNNFVQVGSPLPLGSDTPFSSWRDRPCRLISFFYSTSNNSMSMSIYSMTYPGRTPCTTHTVIASLKAAIPAAQVEFFVFDLASLPRRAAKATAEKFLES
jgi:hypothetical protein